MAVTRALNVTRLTANADTIADGPIAYCGIKAVETAGAVASCRIRSGGVGGNIVWETSLAANGVDYNCVDLVGSSALYLEVVSGAVAVSLYSE